MKQSMLQQVTIAGTLFARAAVTVVSPNPENPGVSGFRTSPFCIQSAWFIPTVPSCQSSPVALVQDLGIHRSTKGACRVSVTAAAKPSARVPGTQRVKSAATRAALIAAGRERFGLVGYHGTGTHDLVALASVTRGALYHHFGDKKDLFEAVFLQLDEELNRAAHGPAGGEPLPKPRNLSSSVCFEWHTGCQRISRQSPYFRHSRLPLTFADRARVAPAWHRSSPHPSRSPRRLR